jgi:transcriptional antiterminator Rof (Rho-off)
MTKEERGLACTACVMRRHLSLSIRDGHLFEDTANDVAKMAQLEEELFAA